MTGAITVEPLTASVGAIVGGVDMRRHLPADAFEQVRRALLDHGVVFLRGQDVTLEQFWAFLENFGEVRSDEASGTPEDTPADVRSADFAYARHGTAVWHADTTSLAEPPIVTALRSVEVPAVGGDTCWSSMTAAWDALSEPMRRMLDGLSAVHSVAPTIARMRELGARFEARYTERNAREQVHPVAVTHPETGRKALYVNESFVTRIVELEPLESAAVLAMLFRHVERPDFTMRWKWRANDVAIWDNRAVQHYAVPDYASPRIMQRLVLAGAKPGEPSALGRALASIR